MGGLPASWTSRESIRLTAPSEPATYFYGACVDAVSREADTENNCSAPVTVTVQAVPAPDLVVHGPRVRDNVVQESSRFWVDVTVQNRGDGASHSTTLRLYRSTDSTISSRDNEVATDSVVGLAPSARRGRTLYAYARDVRTSYYGVCVDPVSDEADTSNNCSEGVKIEIWPASRPPFEVRNLRFSRSGSDVILTWSPSILATYYTVYRCQYLPNDDLRCQGDFGNRSVWRNLATKVIQTSYVDSNVLASPTDEMLTLVYSVQACNSAGCTGPF